MNWLNQLAPNNIDPFKISDFSVNLSHVFQISNYNVINFYAHLRSLSDHHSLLPHSFKKNANMQLFVYMTVNKKNI